MVKKKIEILYISTEKQHVDIMTKALGRPKFIECRKLLQMTEVPKEEFSTNPTESTLFLKPQDGNP
jgi:hypothetical protein